MEKALKKLFSMCAFAVLAACGGGGGESTTPVLYGAIAIKTGGLEAGVVGGQTSQENANALALNRCGSNCEIKEVFVGSKCGSTAYSTNGYGGVMAWGTGNTQSEANSNAMLSCVNSGGTYCSVYRRDCNVAQESSSTSGGVCIGSGSTYVCQSRVCTVSGNGVICSDGQYCPFAVNNGVTSNPVCASR